MKNILSKLSGTMRRQIWFCFLILIVCGCGVNYVEEYEKLENRYMKGDLDGVLRTLQKKYNACRDPRIYYLKGKILFLKRRFSESRRAFKKALRIDKNYVDAKVWLARLYSLDPSTVGKAAELAREVLRIDASNLQARIVMARYYIATGNYMKAAEQLERAAAAEENLKYIYMKI